MAAELIPAREGAHALHRLRLPPSRHASDACEEVRYGLGDTPPRGPLCLDCGDWELDCAGLRRLTTLLRQRGLETVEVMAACPTTLVAASFLGLETRWPPPLASDSSPQTATEERAAGGPADGLLIHRGTLRSGDHLQAEGSVLLLGDLNPGARISAAGHVLVWGRLRGVAHAGRNGDHSARIVALQLRPLQLRIAGAVARGPEDTPPQGLAEEARLEAGEIRIEAAAPAWPLA